jgi:hypothetical protein
MQFRKANVCLQFIFPWNPSNSGPLFPRVSSLAHITPVDLTKGYKRERNSLHNNKSTLEDAMDTAGGTVLRQAVFHPSAWRGKDLCRETSWIHTLSEAAIADIDATLPGVRGKDVISICREDFPLPSAMSELSSLLDTLNGGRGFVVVRGLPFGKYSDDDIARIFWGIGTYFGRAISQNASGDLLGHVRAIDGKKYMEKDVRGYQTTAELFFHNDNCDIVGLLCFRKGKSGGISRIASAIEIYNEVLRTHPEFLDVLYEGFHYDLRGEELPGHAPVTPHRIPIYSYYRGLLSCRYVYTSIMQASRKGGLTLSETQKAAMAFLNETAAREDIRLEMMLEPGDMQFLNNHVCLHSRTSYEEFEEPDRKRHMLRLWLNNQERPLAPRFADRYGGGIGMGVPKVGVGAQ